MSGERRTRSTAADDVNTPNELGDKVARQLNAAIPNMIALFIEAFNANKTNQVGNTQDYSYKTFRSYGAKEFFGIEGAVGLLSWLEGMKSVLQISKLGVGQLLWLYLRRPKEVVDRRMLFG
ncbi:hypothetical protein Tco_1404804 [Tanacetum coccineum]